MKKSFSPKLVSLAGAVFAVMAVPSQAAMYEWNFNSSFAAGSGQSCTGGNGDSANCKTTFTSVTGGLTLTARAYSTPTYDVGLPFDVSGAWKLANIAGYGSSGLGIANRVGLDTGEGASPEHAVDNEGVKDVLVLELPAGSVWDPSAMKLGFGTDTDVQVWVGGTALGANYDFSNACFSGCANAIVANLGFKEITASMGNGGAGAGAGAGGYDLPFNNTPVNFNTNETGRYVVITGRLDHSADAFKVSGLGASQFFGQTPIPGSLALLGAGLIGFAASRRRAIA